MKKLDVLLVHPSNRKETYQGLANEFAAYEPPLWAALLASFLRVRGLNVRILDTNIEHLGHTDAADAIVQHHPLLVAVICYGQQPSASTLVMPGAGALARCLKEVAPDLPLIFVGGHVAALSERTLQEEACDFTCDGEGAYTLLELALTLREAGANWRKTNFSKVRGLLYVEGDELRHTPSAPLVMNLDAEMPGAAWDLLQPERYVAHNWHCFGRLDDRRGYASLYTSLGCPFSCDFCCIQAPFKNGEKVLGLHRTHRHWGQGAVLAQLDYLILRCGVRNIKLADELFLTNTERTKTLLRALCERNYGVHFVANTRLDSYTPELLDMARKAGIEWLPLSIESASEEVLRSVHKGIHASMAAKAREDFHRAGIFALGHLLFGLPADTKETLRRTEALGRELNCEFMNMYCAMAYPGSRLYEQALQEDWRLPENWNGYSQHSYETLPLDTKYLKGSEVLAFRDGAFHRYFSDERYLSMMEKKFGLATRQHLGQMISYQLPRKYLESSERGA